MGIKENLQKLMEFRAVSDYRLAQLTGVPQPTIYRILSGESADPRTATVQKLAAFFNVTPDELRHGAKDLREKSGKFTALSEDAIDLLAAYERLPADRQQAFKDSLFLEVFALEQMPWLKRGRPVKESYDNYEKRMKALASTTKVKK